MSERLIAVSVRLLVVLTRLWPRALRGSTAAGYEWLAGEVLRDAWRSGGWPRLLARWLYEAADVLAVAVRGRPAHARAAALAATAIITLTVLTVLPTLRTPLHAEELVVQAHDPAGEFTLTFHRGVLVAATVDGVPYAGSRLVQSADSVHVEDAAGRVLVSAAFEAPGTIRWAPRSAAAR